MSREEPSRGCRGSRKSRSRRRQGWLPSRRCRRGSGTWTWWRVRSRTRGRSPTASSAPTAPCWPRRAGPAGGGLRPGQDAARPLHPRGRHHLEPHRQGQPRQQRGVSGELRQGRLGQAVESGQRGAAGGHRGSRRAGVAVQLPPQRQVPRHRRLGQLLAAVGPGAADRGAAPGGPQQGGLYRQLPTGRRPHRVREPGRTGCGTTGSATSRTPSPPTLISSSRAV